MGAGLAFARSATCFAKRKAFLRVEFGCQGCFCAERYLLNASEKHSGERIWTPGLLLRGAILAKASEKYSGERNLGAGVAFARSPLALRKEKAFLRVEFGRRACFCAERYLLNAKGDIPESKKGFRGCRFMLILQRTRPFQRSP